MCSGLGVVKEEKQRFVETRPSILASVTDQEHVGGGAWGGEGRDGTGATAQHSVCAWPVSWL